MSQPASTPEVTIDSASKETQQSPSPTHNASVKLEGEALVTALKAQLEFYFSKQNLATDTYLVSHMNAQKFVLIDVIANFPKVRALTDDRDLLVRVMRSCANCQPDEQGKMVRPTVVKNERNTLILRDLKPATDDEVKAIFDKPGCAKPTSVRKDESVAQKSDQGDTWVVTFDSQDECASTAMALLGQTFKDAPIRARVKSETLIKGFYYGDTHSPSNVSGPSPGAGFAYTQNTYFPGGAANFAAGASASSSSGATSTSFPVNQIGSGPAWNYFQPMGPNYNPYKEQNNQGYGKNGNNNNNQRRRNNNNTNNTSNAPAGQSNATQGQTTNQTPASQPATGTEEAANAQSQAQQTSGDASQGKGKKAKRNAKGEQKTDGAAPAQQAPAGAQAAPAGQQAPQQQQQPRKPKQQNARAHPGGHQPQLGPEHFPALPTVQKKVSGYSRHFLRYSRERMAELVEAMSSAPGGLKRPATLDNFGEDCPVICKEPLSKTQLMQPFPIMYPASPSPMLEARRHAGNMMSHGMPDLDLGIGLGRGHSPAMKPQSSPGSPPTAAQVLAGAAHVQGATAITFAQFSPSFSSMPAPQVFYSHGPTPLNVHSKVFVPSKSADSPPPAQTTAAASPATAPSTASSAPAVSAPVASSVPATTPVAAPAPAAPASSSAVATTSAASSTSADKSPPATAPAPVAAPAPEKKAWKTLPAVNANPTKMNGVAAPAAAAAAPAQPAPAAQPARKNSPPQQQNQGQKKPAAGFAAAVATKPAKASPAPAAAPAAAPAPAAQTAAAPAANAAPAAAGASNSNKKDVPVPIWPAREKKEKPASAPPAAAPAAAPAPEQKEKPVSPAPAAAAPAPVTNNVHAAAKPAKEEKPKEEKPAKSASKMSFADLVKKSSTGSPAPAANAATAAKQ